MGGSEPKQPKGDPNDIDVINERSEWLDEASCSFHDESIEEIHRVSNEYQTTIAVLNQPPT